MIRKTIRRGPNTINIDIWLLRFEEYKRITKDNSEFLDVQSKRDIKTKEIITEAVNKTEARKMLFRLYNDYFIPYESICHCEKKMQKIYPIVNNYYNEVMTIKNNLNNNG